MTQKKLEGKLLYYTEQGMECGHLCIQDAEFIIYVSPTSGMSDGRKVYDRNDLGRYGFASNIEVLIDSNWLPLRPYEITEDGKTRVTVKWYDGNTEHQVLSDDLLVEQWSLKGLHTLKDDDILKVLDPISKKVICEGQLDKIPLKVISQTLKGHFEQDKSRTWEQYFKEHYVAELYST